MATMNFHDQSVGEVGGWHTDATAMLKIASDPAGTKARLDELAASIREYETARATADKASERCLELKMQQDTGLVRLTDLQQRIEAQNASLRARELAVAANEEAHRDLASRFAEQQQELVRRENRLTAAVRSLRQYLSDIEVDET
jgi:hypothetical protein